MDFIKRLKEEDHQKATVVTLAFIMLLILFFLLASFEIPDPPLEEEIVEIEMEFGSDYKGGGQEASEVSQEVVPEPEAAIEQETQDESPVVVVSGKGSEKTSTNTTTPTPDPKPKTDNSLGFPGTGTAGSGGGSDKGFGKGGGVGDGGKGPDAGKGTSNTSRKLISKGSIPGQSQAEGNVALKIYVNEFGKVTRTKVDESQTTATDGYLYDLAKSTAKTYRYESIPGAQEQYVGTVVFKFTKN